MRLQLNTTSNPVTVLVEGQQDYGELQNILTQVLPGGLIEGVEITTEAGVISPFGAKKDITVQSLDGEYPNMPWIKKTNRKWEKDGTFAGGGTYDAILDDGTNTYNARLDAGETPILIQIEGAVMPSFINNFVAEMFPTVPFSIEAGITLAGFSSQATLGTEVFLKEFPEMPWLSWDGLEFTLVSGSYNIEYT